MSTLTATNYIAHDLEAGSFARPQDELHRMCVTVTGVVQGVGFRPFVYRLATELGLNGWVNNSPQGVNIEVEGSRPLLDQFAARLTTEKPPRSMIRSMSTVFQAPAGYAAFTITPSVDTGTRSTLILPDLATCPDCLQDIFDPSNRRYRYPFTNCTNCGPRFSIIESLPYDRPNTTMRHFPLCPECRAEYENPLDRRFHAQPNACPICGPHLEFWTPSGERISAHDSALLDAVSAIKSGAIVAVKGLGGFLLMADAACAGAVQLLRQRKHREEKPFAIMCPSLSWVEQHCRLSPSEADLLCSPEAPIVLLKKRPGSLEIASHVAPGSPTLGVMLPYAPLHHLLMAELGTPVVATSGNLSDEPICIDEHEALKRLFGIADYFLVHNRPIARHVDDSIVRVVMDREMVLRRARGYAPLPVHLSHHTATTLAVGAHLKSAVALSLGHDVFIGQHIGDLETTEANKAFRRSAEDLQRLYNAVPTRVACDMHPDYLSTQYVEKTNLPLVRVQHHAAHVFSCIAENNITNSVLGVSWDGTGYGSDGAVWGGEFFRIAQSETTGPQDGADARNMPGNMNYGNWNVTRVAHLRSFPLIGSDRASREPRRSAVALLSALYGRADIEKLNLPTISACSREEIAVWLDMAKCNFNSPSTSSMGRLFDGMASLLGIRQISNFEGQAAMELEHAASVVNTNESYNWGSLAEPIGSPGLHPIAPLILDWRPMLQQMISDIENATPTPIISARFHNTLVEMIVAVARRVGENQIALTGGCFQNAYLLERAVKRLTSEGFRCFWHRLVPPNDGGIALGQIMAANDPWANMPDEQKEA